jgi:hypothetical protein
MRRLLLILTAFFVLASPAQAGWVWPVSGEVITPYRNGTDPYANGQHRGIDIAAAVGTPIVAAASGEVRFAGTAGSSGLTISIRTGDGYDTSYLHLSSLAVRAGAHVSSGDRIGAVGTTGTRSATAPHLHFGVRDAGTRHDYSDPLAFLPPPPPPARAPNPPPPAPATAPEPAPPAATPVPVPRAAPHPHAVPHPAPRTAPHPHAAPRTAPNPHAVPRARPHPIPHARPNGVPHARPRPAPRPRPQVAPLPRPRVVPHAPRHPIPHLQPPRAPEGRVRWAQSASPSNAQPEHPAATPGERSPDLGWVAACAGLLLAAAVLGLTEDGRRATRRTHSRLARAVPLILRR